MIPATKAVVRITASEKNLLTLPYSQLLPQIQSLCFAALQVRSVNINNTIDKCSKHAGQPVAQANSGPALATRRAGHQAGFTIIEVLVSIMLLSIIVLVILTPLSGLFNMTRRSDQQITATQAAQRTLETIRGEWLSGARYRQACVSAPIPQMTPPIAVNVQSLDREGNVTTTATLKTTCGTAADDPPLRRIQVVVKVGKAVSNLSVDVARP